MFVMCALQTARLLRLTKSSSRAMHRHHISVRLLTRRPWHAGGIQMTTCLIIIAIVLAQTGVGKDDHVNEPWVAWFVLVFVCIYIAAYAWSCKHCAPPL